MNSVFQKSFLQKADGNAVFRFLQLSFKICGLTNPR